MNSPAFEKAGQLQGIAAYTDADHAEEGRGSRTKRSYASLEGIEHDHKITWETDGQFLYRLQGGLLLALKEQGRLSEAQYRQAQDRLDRQHREWSTKLQ